MFFTLNVLDNKNRFFGKGERESILEVDVFGARVKIVTHFTIEPISINSTLIYSKNVVRLGEVR
jgi:hypothetical protein